MALEDYEELRDLPDIMREQGAEFRSQAAYLSSRSFDKVRQRQSGGGIRYVGRITKRSFAVDIDDIQVVKGHPEYDEGNPPEALDGDQIYYECARKPAEPALFRRSENHRGSCCKLEQYVYCRIMKPYDYLLP